MKQTIVQCSVSSNDIVSVETDVKKEYVWLGINQEGHFGDSLEVLLDIERAEKLIAGIKEAIEVVKKHK